MSSKKPSWHSYFKINKQPIFKWTIIKGAAVDVDQNSVFVLFVNKIHRHYAIIKNDTDIGKCIKYF